MIGKKENVAFLCVVESMFLLSFLKSNFVPETI